MLRLRVLVAVAVAAAVVSSAAAATTVTQSVVFEPGYRGSDIDARTVTVQAGRGERNELTTTEDAGGAVRVRDAGAPLSVGAGCALDGDTAVCAVLRTADPSVTSGTDLAIHIAAGDGDDAVRVEVDGIATVDGGEGDDRLEAAGAVSGAAR